MQAHRTSGNARRRARSPEQRGSANAALCARLWQLDAVQNAQTILLYAAFGGEAGLAGFAAEAARRGKVLAYPVCGENCSLTAAVPGDLSLALPKRQLDDIIEMIYQLDKLAPGTANYDTLLYGAEVKFYSARLKLSTHLETSLPNFFAAGDGAGITRGLAQAGASGVRAARARTQRSQGA